jgi:hypothetical protein
MAEMNVIIDSAKIDLWSPRVEQNLKDGHDVTLENYDDNFHQAECLRISKAFGVPVEIKRQKAECRFKHSK